MNTQNHGSIIYYDSDGGPILREVTAADVAAMEAMLLRLNEMEYALEAGNTERADVPAVVLKRWFSYVHTGNKEIYQD